MTTHFITAELAWQEDPAELQREIEAELAKRGEPLRWAIAAVDREAQTVAVEAIVTDASDDR